MKAKQFKAAHKYGYRSGLEVKNAHQLDALKYPYRYEKVKVEWEDLAYRTYTPDFVLKNGIIIETKGMFVTSDRRKHLQISKQHPDLDIRFVFTSSNRKLNKGAKSTYGEWCTKHGFLYADKMIPDAWLKEKGKDTHPTLIPFKQTKLIRRYPK